MRNVNEEGGVSYNTALTALLSVQNADIIQ